MAITAEQLQVQIDSEGAGDLAAGLDDAEDSVLSLKGAVGGLGVALGGLAAGGIAKSIDKAAQFESQMADVRKVTAEGTAGQLKEDIMDLSTEIPIAKGELATLAEQAGKFGVEGSENISKFVETVGKIQTATDLAAEEAGKRFAKIAGAVGLPMSEIGKLGNATNKLADTMKTDAGEITDTATRAANTLSQQLGLGEDAVLALSASMNEVSPSSRRAAGSLRRAAESLMDPKKVGDIAGALGITTEEFRSMREQSPGELMNKVATTMREGGDGATQLRGSLGKAATAFSKLGKQQDATAKAQRTVNSQFKNGTSLQEEMDIRTDTLSGQFKLLKNQISNAAITIGDAYLPIVKDAVSVMSPLIDRIAEFISGLSETQLLVGTLVPTISSLVGGVGLLASQFGVLGPAIAAILSPAGLLVGALAAVAAGAVALKTDLISLEGGVDALLSMFDTAKDRITSALGAAIDWIRTQGVPMAQQALRTLATQAVQAFNFGREQLLPAVQQAIRGAWSWATTEGVTIAKNALSTLANQAVQAFNFGKDNLLPKIQTAVRDAWSWVKTEGVTIAGNALTALGKQAVRAFNFGKDNLLPKIQTAVRGAWSWVKTQGVTLATQAFDFLVQRLVATWTFTKQKILPPVQQAIRGTWSWVRNQGVTLATNALSFLVERAVASFEFTKKKILPKVKSAVEGVWQWVRNQGVSLAIQAFDFLVQRLVATWNFTATAIIPKVRTAIDGVVSWIKTTGLSLFKEGFKAIGRNIGPAIVAIIDAVDTAFREGLPRIREFLKNNGIDIIKAGFEAIGTAIRLFVVGIFAAGGLIYTAFKSGIEGIGQWLSNGGATELKNAFTNIVSGIVEYLKNDAYSDLKGAAEFLFEAVIAAAEALYKSLIGQSLIKDMLNDIATFIRTFDLASAAKELLDTVITKFEDLASSVIGNENSIVKTLISDIKSYIETGAKRDIKSAFETLGSAISEAMGNAADQAITSFNETMPDSISVPEVTIGGGSISLPSTEIAGETIGGGSLNIPQATVGGESIDIPELDTGGLVEASGLALIHEGERVIEPAEVDRSGGGTSQGDSEERPIEVQLVIDAPEDSRMASWMRENATVVVDERDNGRERSIKRSRRT